MANLVGTEAVVAGRDRRYPLPLRVAGLAAGALLVSCTFSPVSAQAPVYRSAHHEYRVTTLVEGLEHPWGLAFLPGGEMLVTERAGRLRVVRDGVLDPTPVAGVPAVWASGQGGLLDVALHPDYATNRLVYLSFSKPGPNGATTAVARGRFEGNRLADVQEIFVADAWTTRGQHFGSRMVFDRNGYLFVTVGDRGVMEEAQNRANHQGTTLRLHDDGRVPVDNPFVGQAGIKPEIYTWGNRSPQGLVLHPTTGQLWQVEHGPRGGDELNLLQAGRNYGWPVITHGINYNGRPISDITAKEGMEQPVHYWVPSIATSGLAFYTGDRFPGWKGNVLVGALAGTHLARLTMDGSRVTGEEKLLVDLKQRIRDVRNGPDGYIYVLTDAPKGALLRLEPTGGE